MLFRRIWRNSESFFHSPTEYWHPAFSRKVGGEHDGEGEPEYEPPVKVTHEPASGSSSGQACSVQVAAAGRRSRINVKCHCPRIETGE